MSYRCKKAIRCLSSLEYPGLGARASNARRHHVVIYSGLDPQCPDCDVPMRPLGLRELCEEFVILAGGKGLENKTSEEDGA